MEHQGWQEFEIKPNCDFDVDILSFLYVSATVTLQNRDCFFPGAIVSPTYAEHQNIYIKNII